MKIKVFTLRMKPETGVFDDKELSDTPRLECSRPGKGHAWWRGRPESEHWGGSVHEVGHMLGLKHPNNYTTASPYVFSDGKTRYVFEDRDGSRSIMKRHYLFIRHADNGLLSHDVDALYREFHDADLPPPAAVAYERNL